MVLASSKSDAPSINISLGVRTDVMEHFFLPGSIDFAADDHGALSCCIHEGLMCLVIVCETMLTISESRAISHANDTEQQAQQVAVNPRR